MRKLGVIFIIALMFGSTLVAAGFLDSVTGALSLPTWFKARTIKPVCTATIDESGGYNMAVGQCAFVGGKTVRVVDIGSESIVVDVAGTSKIMSQGGHHNVNGLYLKILYLYSHPADRKLSFVTVSIEAQPVEEDCTEMIEPLSDDKYKLKTLQCANVGGKTVKLIDVGSTSVVIEVDGTSKIVTTSSSQAVNGVAVKVGSLYSMTDRSNSYAILFLSGSNACNNDGTCQLEVGETSDNCADCKARIVETATPGSVTSGCKLLLWSEIQDYLGLTGYDLCKKFSKTCQWVSYQDMNYYLDSSDGKCTGKSQILTSTQKFNTCKSEVQKSGTFCNSISYKDGKEWAEPMSGDVSGESYPQAILCC